MPGLQTTPPDVQTAPSPTSRGDLADLERELGRAGERVAALVHRRRAGVRGLAAPRDARALDAERAEHDAERQVERLEHRALLDVQLEVGGGVLELATAPRSRRSRSMPCSRERIRQRDAVAVGELRELVLVAHRARPRRDEPNSERPKRAPSSSAQFDEPHRDRRLALLRDPPQHLDAGDHVQAAVEPAAVRHRVDVPADQQRALRARPRA